MQLNCDYCHNTLINGVKPCRCDSYYHKKCLNSKLINSNLNEKCLICDYSYFYDFKNNIYHFTYLISSFWHSIYFNVAIFLLFLSLINLFIFDYKFYYIFNIYIVSSWLYLLLNSYLVYKKIDTHIFANLLISIIALIIIILYKNIWSILSIIVLILPNIRNINKYLYIMSTRILYLEIISL